MLTNTILHSMPTVILFNKPYNVLSQFSDPARATLADYIDIEGVYPAGRLDYDSEGLMILTDDGQLQHRISNPQAKLVKTYWVQVEGIPTESNLQPLRDGLLLKDGRCRPAQVSMIDEPRVWPRTPPVRARKTIPTRWLKITLSEGRNRQVRRMTAAIGFPTLRLIRASIGRWTLDGLQPGEYRVQTIHPPQPGKRTANRHRTQSRGPSGRT